MIKDRHGGLFSGLNTRDVNTLREFDRFVQNTEEVYNIAKYGERQTIPLSERPMIPDLQSFSQTYYNPLYPSIEIPYLSDIQGDEYQDVLLSGTFEEMYEHYRDVYEELSRQCSEPSFSKPKTKIGRRPGAWTTNWLGDHEYDERGYLIPPSDDDYLGLSIHLKKQCRIWLTKLSPIIKKLRKLTLAEEQGELRRIGIIR